MADMCSCMMVGRLTANADLKYTNNGTARLGFTVAVGRYEKGQTETSFFDCVQWGKTAESLSRHLTKGRLVAVKGELRQNRWTDNEGTKRQQILMVADSYGGVQMLGSGKQSTDNDSDDRGSQSEPSYTRFDDDIPF